MHRDWSRLLHLWRMQGSAPGRAPEEPIRAELFSIERLKQHAKTLAEAQPVEAGPRRGKQLTPRLHENAQLLLGAYHTLAQATHERRMITPAAEWLLDNFHIVEEQVREIRNDLPPGYYRKLPKLAAGPLKGYPRIFGIAWAFVAHTDSVFDLQKLTRFIQAYQRVDVLRIGELWAVTITLRIVLVENLRRLAEAILRRRAEYQRADEAADRILGVGGRHVEDAETVLAHYSDRELSAPFTAQLSQRLRDQDPRVTPVLVWLETKLAAQGTTMERVITEEHRYQASTNVSVRNVITSMRAISSTDWARVFESVSHVDAVLRERSAFQALDFPTRNRYRNAIEQMAEGSGLSECDVALRALAAAQAAKAAKASSDPEALRLSDPGYYLIGPGRRAFEAAINYRPSPRAQLGRLNAKFGAAGYLAVVGAFTLALIGFALSVVAATGVEDTITLLLLGAAGLIPASEVAIALVNRMVTRRFGPLPLPALALEKGIPAELRSMVVVPTLLTSQAGIEEQVHQLEVHYLANPEGELHFALLSDWTDAAAESAPDDADLYAAAREGIDTLNRRYGKANAGQRFFLFHRKRVWNPSEGKFMGWERKRGKLHELNRLLRGAADTGFIGLEGQTIPPGIRYVVTLDADTRLFQGAVRRLIGKMAHPLNRPRLNDTSDRVIQGYAVLQPRVTPALPLVGEGSFFQRVFSGPRGIDPYALTISDIYQDLFEEGSYCGKGIYDVDAFEAALRDRIPENAVLSHDLLEGTFVRAGLASDIEVVEEFPSRYDVAAARQHRWVRGDWQLLPWIFGRGAGRKRTSIPLLGRWKMFDNLRRSLLFPSMIGALFYGWTMPLEAAALWTGFMLGAIVFPLLLPFFAGLIPLRHGISKRSHFRSMAADFGLAMEQATFSIVFLAHQSWIMFDAIARTLYRLFISRRHLLEWVTAAQTKTILRDNAFSFARQILCAAFFVALSSGFVELAAPSSWPLAAPLFLLWLVSPVAARWASRAPKTTEVAPLEPKDAVRLRLVARRTWRFFEVFVTDEDNMLPPDNFQETPNPVVAHRSSPTNFGMYLLSVAAANDFGWIGRSDMVDRLEATLASMGKLHQFRGHYYNWYDTRTLKPLHPEYVSSVDSGNLAGHLIALTHAAREAAQVSGLSTQWAHGLRDSLLLLQESLVGIEEPDLVEWGGAIAEFEALLGNAPQPIRKIADTDAILRSADRMVRLAEETARRRVLAEDSEILVWARALRDCVLSHRRDLEPPKDGRHVSDRLERIAGIASAIQSRMNFSFLYDTERELLSIGYRVAENSLDDNVYDLLASESRLASFVAIAKGDIPARHWFRLGRTLTPIGNGAALISWSGSMFEYLMPSLVMREPAGSLIEQSNRLALGRQIRYAAQLDVPWGISESQYNARDLEMTYQYSSFGVPDLAYKRGLADSTVIAPYASGLGAMIDPAAAVRNFETMAKMGARGAYGWYEALDFTKRRLQEGEKFQIVRAFMAHHQGMALVSAANALLDGIMRKRFHAEPAIQAVELLLQERMPRDAAVARTPRETVGEPLHYHEFYAGSERNVYSPHTPFPRTHLLSNGKYSVMVTSGGSGYSRWGDIAITRWREDATLDNWGSYIYLRDVRSGDVWSAGYQPVGAEPDQYEARFSEDKAEIIRQDGTLKTALEIVVSPEDDCEARRVCIQNLGGRPREIELTSYAEIALARPGDDAAHQAFSKLFVQTEYIAELGAIIATRRKRSPGDADIWAAHLAVVDGSSSEEPQFETDRARFLGRGHDVRKPNSVFDGWPLSNTAGTVLDPIFSIARRVLVPRDATVHVTFWTLVASSRQELLDLIDKHKEVSSFERAATLAWTQAQVQLHHLGISHGEAHMFQRLANRVIFSDPALRPVSESLKRNELPVSALWAHGISGDLPIVLVSIDNERHLPFIKQILAAHEYWRMKRLPVDLVILNEQETSYLQHLQDALNATVQLNRARPARGRDGTAGSVIVLRADLVSLPVRTLLRSTARALLSSAQGTLADQLRRAQPARPAPLPAHKPPALSAPEPFPDPPPLEFPNSYGGFADEGKEYAILLENGETTPAPWINVIANPDFGFHVSADGSGATWSLNSQQNQITPWSNDPVSDPIGEVLYVRDEDSNEIWTATPQPARDPIPVLVRHGQGYTRFDRHAPDLSFHLVQYVALNDPIKISRLKIANRSGRTRRLSVTAYADLVLGPRRGDTAHNIVTEIDDETDAMFAQNTRNADFGTRLTFADLSGRQRSWTADRREFIGRNGSLGRPAALTGNARLSQRTGAGLDPCIALQAPVTLGINETVEVAFFLGQTESRDAARDLLKKYRGVDLEATLGEVKKFWDDTLGAVQIETPDRSFDILMNRWLLYQALVCRVWARAGFYQASGAYGFRDQLQDIMALSVARPETARAHILRAAARQFPEGDVQHWWLPGSGRGIRTKVSDDRIWLAHATAHYVSVTGDAAILDERIPFLNGPALKEEEHEIFFQPDVSAETATLFEHCARGLDGALAVGRHGLPPIGAGDWNDGMNRVGAEGKGESIWLGWFLAQTLNTFAPIAEARGEAGRVASWLVHIDALREALDQHGWDGHWYKRAFFDDGTPIGSAVNNECRIDSIAQSWAVISGVAAPRRAARAMAAVEKYLLRREEGLLLLFAPPFDKTRADPGYIKGYPPGIRENGGQYTHGALWAAQAFAMLGDGDKAMELLSLMSPITRTETRALAQRYKVEPYVVCADLYSRPPHIGRGGWTWYTGSAGVMYRIALEYVLGLRVQGDRLVIQPCVPRSWPGFTARIRRGSATYVVRVDNTQSEGKGVVALSLDGTMQPKGANHVPLADDGKTHEVRVVLGSEPQMQNAALSATSVRN